MFNFNQPILKLTVRGTKPCFNAMELTVTLKLISSKYIVVVTTQALEIIAMLSAETMEGLKLFYGI